MTRHSIASLAVSLAAGIALVSPAPALAAAQQETNKTINVVGVNSASSFAFVAVNSPGPSAHPTCTLSLLGISLTTAGLEQYETLRDAKIAGKSVTIFFDDSDCQVDQVQLQED